MKVLVTGAAGFVGPHLINELINAGHAPIAVINTKEKPRRDIKTHRCNLLNPNDVSKIDFNNIDAVIHLAGLAATGLSFEKPMDYINTNIGIEINLFEAALKQEARPKFLVISSGALYDPREKLPLDETSKTVPSSPYAVSKIGQEQMAHYYGIRGFEYIIARPFNHMGPGQGEGFIVPDLAKQVVEAEKGLIKEIRVGNLEAKRDYTDVRDIVRAYRLLAEKGKSGETYNICSGISYSGQQILNSLLASGKVKIKITQDQSRMRPSDTPNIYGDHSKLTKDTGWDPIIKFEQTLRDALVDWRTKI